jgi:GTP-binding protein HflX
LDRRRVRERIGILKRRLTTVERTRALQRQERLEVPFSSVALVGYTNSGKSTLMNALTRAGVLAEERLFATLDPTTRSLRLPNNDQVMITDTVGFINNIPHALIEAFKSTLEEVRSANLLLHVVDMTSPLLDQQILVVNAVLKEIGAGQACHLMVANKIDLVPETGLKGLDCNGPIAVCPVSSLTGQGIDGLLDKISQLFDQGKERVEICLAPHQGFLLPLLYQRGRILEERVEGDRIHLTALVTPKLAGQMKKWLRENGFKDPT